MVPKGLWTKHPLYKTWKNLKRKGTEGWPSFAEFQAEVGTRPKGHVLSKKDKTKLFSPTNWEWKPIKKQVGRMISHDGQTRSEADWARILSIPRTTIRSRLASGWTPEEALSTPVQSRVRTEYWISACGDIKGHKIDNQVICQRGSLQGAWDYLLECIKACKSSSAKCTFRVMKNESKKTEMICEVTV